MKEPGNEARSWRHFALLGFCLALWYVIGVSSLKAYPATHEDWDSIKHLSTSQSGPINSFADTIESVVHKTRLDHAPGYFLLLNLWSRLTGLDLFTLRLFSVFIGLFALVITYRLALLTGKPEAALDAALLASFIAFAVYYSQIVRMYSLLPALTAAVLWSYWKIRSSVGAVPLRLWAAFVFASAAILWAHYFGTIVLAAVGIYHLLFAPKNRRWLRICLAAICGGLLFAPWLPVFAEGFLTRDVPAADSMSLLDSALAMASIYTNGLSWVVPVVGIVLAANLRRLNRIQRYIIFMASAIALLMLIGNEFAPLLIARRMRYTLILALPWACALAIGLNSIPRWKVFRIPFLALWIASYVAYSDSDRLLLYSNSLAQNLHQTPHYQDLLYEPGLDIEMSDYIVSFHPDAELAPPVYGYYDSFHGSWGGLIHITTSSDGTAEVQSSKDLFGSIDSMPFWRFRVWLVYNPQQTTLEQISAFSKGFRQFYRSCGAYVEKPQSVIALYVPMDVSCQIVSSTGGPATNIHYDNGSALSNIAYEMDSETLKVTLWWARTEYGKFAYSLQLFDADGAKAAPQADAIITDGGFYVEELDLSYLPAGEFVLKLIVYNSRSLESLAGLVVDANQRFERDVEIGRVTLTR